MYSTMKVLKQANIKIEQRVTITAQQKKLQLLLKRLM